MTIKSRLEKLQHNVAKVERSFAVGVAIIAPSLSGGYDLTVGSKRQAHFGSAAEAEAACDNFLQAHPTAAESTLIIIDV